MDPRPGVVWFRRDLRLDDNPAWAAATVDDTVVALVVIEPGLLDAAGPFRRRAFLDGLGSDTRVMLVRAGGGVVQTDHLPIIRTEVGPPGTWGEAQRDFRKKFLRAALERNNGNRSATARELGISRQALLYHIRNLGL